MSEKGKSEIHRMVGLAIMATMVVALQIFSSYVRFGAFSISLALVPVVVGAAIYGKGSGAFLGSVCGIVVLLFCVIGVDIGGNQLYVVNPGMTTLLCILKGALAGFAAGLVFKAASKKNIFVGTLCASIACPVVNTGIFITAMVLFFHDKLVEWAANTPILYFSIVGLAGINFILELGVGIALSQAVVRILKAVRFNGLPSGDKQ